MAILPSQFYVQFWGGFDIYASVLLDGLPGFAKARWWLVITQAAGWCESRYGEARGKEMSDLD